VLLHEGAHAVAEREHLVRGAEICDRHAFSIAGMGGENQTG